MDKLAPQWTVTEAVVDSKGWLVETKRTLKFRAENGAEARAIAAGWAKYIGAAVVYVQDPWSYTPHVQTV